jgi:hypothetical protein
MEYQLILQWPASSVTDYDALIQAEDILMDHLSRASVKALLALWLGGPVVLWSVFLQSARSSAPPPGWTEAPGSIKMNTT